MIYSLLIFDHSRTLAQSSYCLDDFWAIYRPKIKSIIEETAFNIIQKDFSANGSVLKISETIQDTNIVIYCLVNDGYFIAITKPEYPQRAAYKLLDKLRTTTDHIQIDNLIHNDQPDQITLLQNELDETKIIIMDSLEKLIDRGDSLDALALKVDALHDASRVFVDDTKKMNSCCTLF